MQFKLTLIFSLAFSIASAAGAYPPNYKPDKTTQPSYKCSDPSSAVPLLRAYNGATTDHFYTTDVAEMQNAVTTLGYSSEGSVGKIFPSKSRLTVPLYRVFQPAISDHFYTTNEAERDNAITTLGYHDEGVTGYVYPNAICGAVPLYRLYSGAASDHFYTPSASERDNAAQHLGYNYEGIAAYILPA